MFLSAAGLAVLALAAGCAAVVWTSSVLRGGKVRSWVNGDPDKLLLAYDQASSPWPGRIRVRGLRLRGRDPNVEWEFRIDDCRATISLPDLIRKRFHATSVEATGLSFRLRQRVEEGRAKPERVRFLPPIEGFAPVPLRGEPPALPDRNAKDLWEVSIDRLKASPVKEIWIDAYRYEGSAVLEGRLHLRPRLRASVGPATLEWSGGTLTLFGRKAADPIRARVECRIEPFDPERVRGSAVWDSLSAKADWGGDLAGLEFLNPLLGDSPRVSGGRGTMSGRIRLESGKGEARVSLAARGAQAQYPKETLTGDLSAELRMAPWRPEQGIGLVEGSRVELRDVRESPAKEREWWGEVRAVSGSLRSADHGLRLTAEVESRCRDARPINTVFGVGLPRWTQGLLTLEGFSGRAGVDFAPRLTRARGLDASGGNFRVRGDFVRAGDAKQGAFLLEDGALRAGVEIDGPSTRLHVLGARDWFFSRRPVR